MLYYVLLLTVTVHLAALDVNDNRIVAFDGTDNVMRSTIDGLFGKSINDVFSGAKTIEIAKGSSVETLNEIISVVGAIIISNENTHLPRALDSIKWRYRITTKDGTIIEIGDWIKGQHIVVNFGIIQLK